MRKFEGKTAVITGASSGIGESCARKFVRAIWADQSVSCRGGGSADKRFGDGPQTSTRGSIL